LVCRFEGKGGKPEDGTGFTPNPYAQINRIKGLW